MIEAGSGIDIVRMMAVRDEADVLSLNLDWYHREGIRTVIVDNGSTDGSFEICRAALADGRIAALDRLVTEEFEWRALLARLVGMARGLEPDWLMLTAPDEFFETASGEPLGEALRRDASSGANLVKFFNMEFWMTERDDPCDANPLTRMEHYSCYDVEMYRAYPNVEGIDLLTRYGHRPIFPDDRPDIVAPTVYVSRHYKLRSIEQARRKVRRIRPTRNEPDAHTHYLKYTEDAHFFVPSAHLHRYRFDHDWRFESVYDGRRSLPRPTRMPEAGAARGRVTILDSISAQSVARPEERRQG